MFNFFIISDAYLLVSWGSIINRQCSRCKRGGKSR